MDFICVNGDEDYYKLLGVAKNVDNRDIRRAFKKLAVKHHPDKNKVSEQTLYYEFSLYILPSICPRSFQLAEIHPLPLRILVRF
jgi:hypothetical protein